MFTMDSVLKTFYSYLWVRKNEQPWYVGKGTGNRAFQRSKGHWAPKDRSRIFVFPQDSEADAFQSEKDLIALFGRKDLGTGCLYNRTEGGEGVSGPYISTPKRVRATIENLKKATDAIRGVPKTIEQRRLNSEAQKRLAHSKEWGQHISAAKTGKSVPKLRGANNARWGKPPANVDALRKINASRPRDAQGRFFHDKP
jgi:hypothetical protein